MNILNKARRFFKQTAETVSRRISFIPSWHKNKPTWKDWNTENAVENGYKSSTWVYRCVSKKMEAISSVKWKIKDLNTDDYIDEHPLVKLLNNPNPNMSGRDLFEYLVAHLELGGNGLWHKVKVDGVPVELWPIPPDAVSPVAGDDNFIDHYEIVKTGTDSTDKIIPVDEIVHAKYINPSDFLWGVGPLQAGARIVDTDNEAVSWNKLALENRGVTDGIFAIKERLTEQQFQEARERVKEQYSGKENARTPWVLDGGVDFKEMGMSAKEMDFIESRKFNMYEIHALFGVDPLLTGAPDPASRANKEEARKSFWEDTILPVVDDLQSLFNLQLVKEFGDNLVLEYDVSHIPAMKENLTTKLENAIKLFDLGYTQEQINERLDLGFDDAVDIRKPEFEPSDEGFDLQLNSYSVDDNINIKSKKDRLQRQVFWKRVEKDREDIENQLVNNLEELFKTEADFFNEIDDLNETVITKVIENHADEWLDTVNELFRVVLEFFGETELERLEGQVDSKSKKEMNFDLFNDRVMEWIDNISVEQVELILNTSQDVAIDIYRKGLEEGLTNDEIGRNLRDRFLQMGGETEDLSRAMRVTRTLTAGSSNFAQLESARQVEEEYGVKTRKTWVSSGDARVRDTHETVDGETRELQQLFSNGLLYPGDLENGTAEEVINCRCTTIQGVID